MQGLPVVEKVGAFILRQSHEGVDELLLFKHADFPEVAAQIPGGTIEVDRENIEEGLRREIWEESGLRDLPIIRSLGVSEWVWPEKQVILKGHLFVLRAPAATPDAWTHLVGGSGEDAHLRFTYYWLRPTRDFRPGPRLDSFLGPEHLPELFAVERGQG